MTLEVKNEEEYSFKSNQNCTCNNDHSNNSNCKCKSHGRRSFWEYWKWSGRCKHKRRSIQRISWGSNGSWDSSWGISWRSSRDLCWDSWGNCRRKRGSRNWGSWCYRRRSSCTGERWGICWSSREPSGRRKPQWGSSWAQRSNRRARKGWRSRPRSRWERRRDCCKCCRSKGSCKQHSWDSCRDKRAGKRSYRYNLKWRCRCRAGKRGNGQAWSDHRRCKRKCWDKESYFRSTLRQVWNSKEKARGRTESIWRDSKEP